MKDISKLQRDMDRELKHDNMRRAKKLRHRARKLERASLRKDVKVQGIDWKDSPAYVIESF